MKFHTYHHFWGIASIGERGQVVIPVKARNILKLKKGDRLFIFTKYNGFIGMIKIDALSKHLKKWLEKLEGTK